MFMKEGYIMSEEKESSTYAVKLDSSVKQELQGLLEGYKEDTGATAGEFMKTLLEVYKTNKIVSRVSSTDADIKELNALTGRIYSIYSNLIERNNNSNSVLQQEFSEQLSKKDITIDSLKNKIEGLNENYELLQSAYNDSCKDKEDIEKNNIQFQELNNSYKLNVGKLQEELTSLQELKSINKGLNEEITSVKELLSKQQVDNIALNDNIKERNNSITQLNKTVENNKVVYAADLERLNKEHEKDIQSIKDKLELEKDKAVLQLKQLHQEEIEKLQSKYNTDISKYNVDYKKLLEELNKNSHTSKRPASSNRQSK